MTFNIDANLLTSIYQSKLGLSGASTGGSVLGAPTRKVAPTAPWNQQQTPVQVSAALRSALGGSNLINENNARLDLPGASQDYRKLFALYQGLSTLDALAVQSRTKGLTAVDRARVEKTFAAGVAEVGGYLSSVDLDKLRLIQGDLTTTTKTTAPIIRSKTEYVTPPLVSGSSTNAVTAFQGNVQFTIQVKRGTQTFNVPIDLSGLPPASRTIGNVANYVNQQLTAAGVDVRVASQRIPGLPKTTQVAGKTVQLGPPVDQWALKIKVAAGETVSFSAPATAGAVYVAQNVGNPDPDKNPSTADGVTQRQFLKFQTDTTNVGAPPQPPGEANWVDGRVFAQTLGPEVGAVHATKVGPDGTVYVLADVTDKTAGQDIKGTQDVALLKYDRAGKLIYSRTLGAADEATGLGLAIASDGKVAISGSVKGTLSGVVDGPVNSGVTGTYANKTDSFVTLLDASGQELWTERRGARQEDEASQVAFGADGTVYVSGRAKSALPNTSAIGGWDSYIEAFTTDAKGKPVTAFTQTVGTAGTDKPAGLVVDGTSIVTATVEAGRAVLRRFDVSGATPVLTSTQDLGDLQGGDIAGLALDGGEVVLAGTTSNGALNGTVSKNIAGGQDAFAVRIASDLSGGARIAYYGGLGDDRATSLSVANGEVWIGGSATQDLPGEPKIGTQDGFIARLDVDTGAVNWSQRFTGKDGRAAPTAIAVDPNGASVLDRIGLPNGDLELAQTQRLTDLTTLRAGDTFTVKSSFGIRSTVTIEAADTLDTLAQKIRRASGFQAKVTVGTTTDGNRKLTIAPASPRATIEFGAGKTDKDALEVLGIPEGAVRATVVDKNGKTAPADGKGPYYGLGLDSGLKLETTDDFNHARADIAKALGIVRQVYKDLVAAASPFSAQAAAKPIIGPVPAYLTNQIANYQAALARLTGGG
jgi:hypothetical protein